MFLFYFAKLWIKRKGEYNIYLLFFDKKILTYNVNAVTMSIVSVKNIFQF